MKCSLFVPAVLLSLVFVSSCTEREEGSSATPEPTVETEPQPQKKVVTEEKPTTEKVSAETSAPAPPAPPVTSPTTAPAKSADQAKLEKKDYYTEENLAEAKKILSTMTPEMKEKILTEMKGGSKIAAIKVLRAESGSSLAVQKLTVEMLAISEGVSALF
ncbi:MAG: hypothetical protein CMO55_15925 [Verrucomicrobiales bacterium]|nr:hypothetical protein [Verrucomicrobiales bacterium]